MAPIELKHTAGPFGDETNLYDVIIRKENMTVQDLIDYAVKQRSGDWGYISIMGEGGWLNVKNRLEYRWGTIASDDIPSEIKTKIIPRCKASGGWSRMDYDIYGL